MHPPTWQSDRNGARALIVPDGCRDLIVRSDPEGRLSVVATELDDCPRWVKLSVGTHLTGWRLQPGTEIHADALSDITVGWQAPEDLAARLDEVAQLDSRVAEALAGLGRSRRVESAARTLGVHARTLRRLLVSRTGRGPKWWMSLARVRRASRRVGCSPLIEVALAEGYADQAHMTREFRRWLGCTPARLSTEAREAIWSAGYDGIGVPSSTTNPIGSRT